MDPAGLWKAVGMTESVETGTNEQVIADTPITGVTVFTDGARVVRTGLTEVQAGVRPEIGRASCRERV